MIGGVAKQPAEKTRGSKTIAYVVNMKRDFRGISLLQFATAAQEISITYLCISTVPKRWPSKTTSFVF